MLAKVASKLRINIPPAHGISAHIIAPDVGTSGRAALGSALLGYDFRMKCVGLPYIIGYDTVNRDISFDGGTFSDTVLSPEGKIGLTAQGIINGVGYYTTPVVDLGDQHRLSSMDLDYIVNNLATISKIEIKTHNDQSLLPSLPWVEHDKDDFLGLNGARYTQIKLTLVTDINNLYSPTLRGITVFRDFIDDDDIFALGSEFPFSKGLFIDTDLDDQRKVILEEQGGIYPTSGQWISPIIDLGDGRYFKSLTWESKEPEGTSIDSAIGDPKTLELRASLTRPSNLLTNPYWTDFNDWTVNGLTMKSTVIEEHSEDGVLDIPLNIFKNASVVDDPDKAGEKVIQCKGAYSRVGGYDFVNDTYESYSPARLLDEFEPVSDGDIEVDIRVVESDAGIIISPMEYLTDVWKKEFAHLLIQNGKIYDCPLVHYSEKVELADIPYNEWLSLKFGVDTVNDTCNLKVAKLLDTCDTLTWGTLNAAQPPVLNTTNFKYGYGSLDLEKGGTHIRAGFTQTIPTINGTGLPFFIRLYIKDKTVLSSTTALKMYIENDVSNSYSLDFTQAELRDVDNDGTDGINILGGIITTDFAANDGGSLDPTTLNGLRLYLWTDDAADLIPFGYVRMDGWFVYLVDTNVVTHKVTAGINAVDVRAFPSTSADVVESFSGTSLDSGKWSLTQKYAPDGLRSISVNEALLLDFPVGDPPDPRLIADDHYGIISNFELTGNYEVEVDWEFIKAGWSESYIPEGLQFAIEVMNDEEYGNYINPYTRAKLLYQGRIGTETHGNNTNKRGLRMWTTIDSFNKPKSGTVGEPLLLDQMHHKFRFKRNYKLITIEYWDGADWYEYTGDIEWNDKPAKVAIYAYIWKTTGPFPFQVKINNITIRGDNTYNLIDTEFFVRRMRITHNVGVDTLQLDGVDTGDAILTYDAKDKRNIDVIRAGLGVDIKNNQGVNRNRNFGRFRSIGGDPSILDEFNDSDLHDGWIENNRNGANVTEVSSGCILFTDSQIDSLARLNQDMYNFQISSKCEIRAKYELPVWDISNLPDSLFYRIMVEPSTRYQIDFTVANANPASGFTSEWENKVSLRGIDNTSCFVGYNGDNPGTLDTNGDGTLIDLADKGVPTTTANGIWLYQNPDDSYTLIINNTTAEAWLADGEVYVPGEITITNTQKTGGPALDLTSAEENIEIYHWPNTLRLMVQTSDGKFITINRQSTNDGNKFYVEYIAMDHQINWGSEVPFILDNMYSKVRFASSDPIIRQTANAPVDYAGNMDPLLENIEVANLTGLTSHRVYSGNVPLQSEEQIRIVMEHGFVTHEDEYTDQSVHYLVVEYNTSGTWIELFRKEIDPLSIKNFNVECTNTRTNNILQAKLTALEVIGGGNIKASLANVAGWRWTNTFNIQKSAGSGTATLQITNTKYYGTKIGSLVVDVLAGPTIRVTEPDGLVWDNISPRSGTYYLTGDIQFTFDNFLNIAPGDQWIIDVKPSGDFHKFSTRKARYVRHYAWGSDNGDDGTHWLHLGVFNTGTQDLALGKHVKTNYTARTRIPAIPQYSINPLDLQRQEPSNWLGYYGTIGGTTLGPETYLRPSENVWNIGGASGSVRGTHDWVYLDMRTNRDIDCVTFSDMIQPIDNNFQFHDGFSSADGYFRPADGDEYDDVEIEAHDGAVWYKIGDYKRYHRYSGRRWIYFNPVNTRYIRILGRGNTNDYLQNSNYNPYFSYMTACLMTRYRYILTNEHIHWSFAYSGYHDVVHLVGKAGETKHPYVEVDLGELLDINTVSVQMYNYDERRYYNQMVQISEDGISWETVWTGLNPTGGIAPIDNGSSIELRKKNAALAAIRPELLPASGWLAQVEADWIEPEYNDEFHVLSMFSTRNAGIGDLDGVMFFSSRDSQLNIGYGDVLHSSIDVAGIVLFNQLRHDYTRYGGLFEYVSNDGKYMIWNGRTKQWVEYKQIERDLAQSFKGNQALAAGPTNPDWPPVSFEYVMNVPYIFEIERSFIDEDNLPYIDRLKIGWIDGINDQSESYDSVYNGFTKSYYTRKLGYYDIDYTHRNQKYFGERIARGCGIRPDALALYNNNQASFSIYKDISGVLTEVDDIKSDASLSIFHGDWLINSNVYKIIHVEDFFQDPAYGSGWDLTQYTWIEYWWEGVKRTRSTSTTFRDRFECNEPYHRLFIERGDSSGGTGVMWTGKPIDISKGAIIQWMTYATNNDDSFMGLCDNPDPYDLWDNTPTRRIAGFKYDTGSNKGIDIYYNGIKVKDWPSDTYAYRYIWWRIEILPDNRGTRFWVNSSSGLHNAKWQNDAIFLNGRPGAINSSAEESWKLIYETDVPLSGNDIKYFGIRKLPNSNSGSYDLVVDNLVFAECQAVPKTFSLPTGNDYDTTFMTGSLGNAYANGYDPDPWGVTIPADTSLSADGATGIKMEVEGNAVPVPLTRDIHIQSHLVGGALDPFYFDVDGDFDVEVFIDLTNFPSTGEITGSQYAQFDLRSWTDGSEVTVKDGVEFRFQTNQAPYDRVYARYKANGLWSKWMGADVTRPNVIGFRVKRVGPNLTMLFKLDDDRWNLHSEALYAVQNNKWSIRLRTYLTSPGQWTTPRGATFKDLKVRGINYATTGTVLKYGMFKYDFTPKQLDQKLIFRVKDADGNLIESASVDVMDTAVMDTGAMAKDLVLIGDKTRDVFIGRVKLNNFKTVPLRYSDIKVLSRYNVNPDPDPGEDSDWSPWDGDGYDRIAEKYNIAYNSRFIQLKLLFSRRRSHYNPRLTSLGFDMDLTWHKDSEPFDNDVVWGVGGSLSWLEVEQDQDISEVGGEYTRYVQVKTTLRS